MNLEVYPLHLCWPKWNSVSFDFSFHVRPWPYQGRNSTHFTLSKERRVQFQLVERHCIGFLNGGTHQPCPHVADTHVLQCETCRDNKLTSSCAACRGDTCRNPQARDTYCRNPFVCYLAGFLPKLIKVGVTLKTRYLQRLFEQGADIATILAIKPSGKQAKQLEQSIAELEVTDRVRKAEKRRGLYNGSLQNLSSRFQTYKNHIKNKFSMKRNYTTLKLYKKAPYPHLKRKPLSLPLKKQKRISGKVIGIKGSWFVFQERKMYYAINVWELAGWVIQKTDTQMKTQLPLFE